ncbi:alpha/beta hydrolase [Streptomyces sp. WMMC500]|uniref:alpha/beta fold hydrolase n=1 Tax=Streptomyces sp. WMMC500 TaxID=3015154 RepID=UPI00248CEF55|nr:alpha/beta hydrolase [Streptomyces sp. WMMC500]WBB58355.1 alpha/beta hydrolase [Streptomyces sp. WMMC500]
MTATATPAATTLVDSGLAPVGELEMYYEIHGTPGAGDVPVVLIHGALSAIGTSFGAVLPLLAEQRQVIALDLQAHGRTADIDRPFSTAAFAADVAGLLRHLGVAKADVFGYSLGAGVALQVALDRPELVRKLVLTSVSYTTAGIHPGLLDGIAELQPEHLAGSPFEAEYAEVAPRVEDWPRLIERVKEFDAAPAEWTEAQVSGIDAPVMLVIGDSDIIRPEHAVEMFRLLGGGVAGLPRARLAVLPGATHITVMHRGTWLAAIVGDFLDAEDPAAGES